MTALYYLMILVQSTGFVGCCSVENLNNVVENAIVSCRDNLWCKATCYRGYIFRTGREVESFSCQDGKWTPLLSSCKRLTDCCSVENINNVVKNAIVSCPYNLWCTATCYQDFIFPSGVLEMSSYCKDGVWTPLLSSCKSLPVVSMTYSAQWSFAEILPSRCRNISTRLDDLEKEIVDIFSNRCQELNGISASVQFNYSFMAFTVKANFTAVYRNYTARRILNICVDLTVFNSPRVLNFTTMFKDVTCKGSNLSNTIYRSMYVSKRLEYCLNGTEVHNVTTSSSREMEQYCDFKDKATTIEAITQGNSTSDSSTCINMHQTTNGVFVKQIPSDISKRRTSIYILVPAAGIVLISGIVTLVVCRRKRAQAQEREKSYETVIRQEQTQYINMADITHHYDVIGYGGERIQESRS